jgi:hypothetical protein
MLEQDRLLKPKWMSKRSCGVHCSDLFKIMGEDSYSEYFKYSHAWKTGATLSNLEVVLSW